MSGLPWFRLYAEFAFDPEIQSLAFEDQRHFVVALCLKCSGILDKKHTAEVRERVIKKALGLDHVAYHEAKNRLMANGLIDEKWQPTNWAKRQFLSDSSTDRVRKHRKNKKAGSGDETFHERPQIQSTDTETEEDPPTPRSGGQPGQSLVPDPLVDPFSGTDPLAATPQSKDAKAEEQRVGRELLKRSKVAMEDKPDPPFDEIAKLYVELCASTGAFLALRYLTPQRRQTIKARWYEAPERQDLEWWRKYFSYVRTCKGLQGRDWANFGFLISDKMVDITEGKYEQPFAR